MKKKILNSYFGVLIPILVVCIVLWFFSAVANLDRDRQLEDKQNLETVLRRAAVLCYAAEGAYPPDLEYLLENYNVQFDESRFAVMYESIASNLMPDITVLERQQ